eukprot:403360568
MQNIHNKENMKSLNNIQDIKQYEETSQDATTFGLITISNLYSKGKLSDEHREKLKDMVFEEDSVLLGIFQAYNGNQYDLDEAILKYCYKGIFISFHMNSQQNSNSKTSSKNLAIATNKQTPIIEKKIQAACQKQKLTQAKLIKATLQMRQTLNSPSDTLIDQKKRQRFATININSLCLEDDQPHKPTPSIMPQNEIIPTSQTIAIPQNNGNLLQTPMTRKNKIEIGMFGCQPGPSPVTQKSIGITIQHAPNSPNLFKRNQFSPLGIKMSPLGIHHRPFDRKII